MSLRCFYCGKNEGCKGSRSFHKFPSDSKKCELWLHRMGLKTDLAILNEWRLCSDHFDKKFLSKNNDRVRLLPGSVPNNFGRHHLKCVCCDNLKIRGSNKSFRKFPLKNAKLLKKWLETIGLENFYPNEKSLICDDHFEKRCFYNGINGYVGLKVNSFPTLFSKTSSTDNNGTVPIEDNIKPEPIEEANESYERQRNRETSVSPVKNKKRFSTEELPDPKHLKLMEPEDNRHSQDEDDTTAECIADKRYYSEDRTYISFCFILSLFFWLVAFLIPNLGVKTSSRADSKATDNGAECLSTSEDIKNTKKASVVPHSAEHVMPIFPDTPQRVNILKHDHHYDITPTSLNRRYLAVRRKLKRFQIESKVQKEHIRRLKKTVSTLTEIVSELRRTKAVSEEGLACLDSIANDSDDSQFVNRFLKNLRTNNSAGNKSPVKKRLFKS